ncbi:MAG: baeRF3 domain-containing protein [Mucilaginibacter sp.]
MNLALNPDIREVTEVLHYRPALSITLPIQPHISLKTEMAHALKIVTDKAERELQQNYPADQCELIINKLSALVKNLEIPVNKKGLVIYVSPAFEKVLFLDITVAEKLIVDESFEIRDLVYNAKQAVNFLLLVLSGNETRIFLGDLSTLTPLPCDIPASVEEFLADSPERVANFSDMVEKKQLAIEKFLRQIDDELDTVLSEHQLPVLLLGTKRILGHFKKISKHLDHIMDYVDGNYESATIAELKDLTLPYTESWKAKQQNEVMARVDDAESQFRLSVGIQEVWRDAQNGKGKLLIVEKNYRFAAQHEAEPDVIQAIKEPYNQLSYIRDAVDDVIEKVLQSGGDVEFMEDGTLGKFDHILLIKHYE